MKVSPCDSFFSAQSRPPRELHGELWRSRRIAMPLARSFFRREERSNILSGNSRPAHGHVADLRSEPQSRSGAHAAAETPPSATASIASSPLRIRLDQDLLDLDAIERHGGSPLSTSTSRRMGAAPPPAIRSRASATMLPSAAVCLGSRPIARTGRGCGSRRRPRRWRHE